MRKAHGEHLQGDVISGSKDTSNYLGKGLRTAQRYERESHLPLRRPLRVLNGEVIANKAELDAWVETSPVNQGLHLANGDVSWLRSKLLAGLSDTAMQQLLDTAKVCHIGPNEHVIVRGSKPDYLLLLKTGRTRCYILTEDGREMVLLWAAPGEVLGLVSLLPSPPNYMVNATTVSACNFLLWDHETIRSVATEHPPIMENGFRLALYHLAGYMKRHVTIVTRSAESRLANRLVQLATSGGEVRNSGIEVDITNERLGSLSDIGRSTTSRILSKWEHQGRLSKHRGGVTILDPESLMAA